MRPNLNNRSYDRMGKGNGSDFMPDKKDIDEEVEKPRGKHARLESSAIPRIDDSMLEAADEAEEKAGAHSVSADETVAFSMPEQQYASAQFGVSGYGNNNDIVMPKDRSKVKKIVAIVLGVIVGIILVVYIAGVAIFSDRLYPNTVMGDTDVSLKSTADLRQLVNNRVDGYKLTIKNANGFSQTITASDVGLTCDSNVKLTDLAPDHNAFAWPVEVFKSHEIVNGVDSSYNLLLVQSVVGTAVDEYNKTAVQPTSAKISFNATKNNFEVVPEVAGTALDKDAVVSAVVKALMNLQTTLTLDSTCALQPAVVSTDARLETAMTAANTMAKADVTYTLANVEVAHLTPATIASWITVDDQCNATLDDEKLNAWIATTEDSLDTVGSKRTYTRADGKVITVEGGAYGWEVDAEAFAEQVKNDVADGTTKKSAIPCSMEGTGFTTVGGADWGKRYVDVDLSEQHVRFYGDDGTIIWEADCISGAPTDNHATPQGVWYVVTKESPSTLVGYAEDGVTKEYSTQVQYWMPFEGTGVGFHDATWQPSFGGTMYMEGYGSHGCINLSYSSAETLYDIIAVNDVVVVHE